MPRQWKNQENGNNWATNHGKGQGGNMQVNGVFTGAVQIPKVPDPYSTQAENGTTDQTPQWKGCQAPRPEHCHPVLIKFISRFLQKYATPYFKKVLLAGNKTVRDSTKHGGYLQGKRYMRMHHILEKFMNPNCSLYHAQAKEMDDQYEANVYTVLVPCME